MTKNFKFQVVTTASLSDELMGLLEHGATITVRDGSNRAFVEGFKYPDGRMRPVYIENNVLYVNKNFRWFIDLASGEIVTLDISVEEYLETR